MGNNEEARIAFGEALAEERGRRGFTQRKVAEILSERLGDQIRKPYSDASVGQWENGQHAPEPAVVFELEAALELEPGDLSHHLGYVPTGPVSLLTAIDSDPSLSDMAKRVLRALLREVSSGAKS